MDYNPEILSVYLWISIKLVCLSDKKTLLLYGYPDVQWEVRTQPADKKTPVVGMEFSTDMVQERDWLSRIAACCDAWLVRGTTFLGARNGFVKAERIHLFHMMNDLPDIREVVTKTVAQKEVQDNNITTKSKSNTTRDPSKLRQALVAVWNFVAVNELFRYWAFSIEVLVWN
ncbi:hypothetical protein LguiB_031877 [Lonicera macranthoides]